ncbi:MAG: hypothetical protein NC253_08665 [Ruminococcus sp.]|nr:hypothetical protein [Ruminococcus sp.]MCM1382768.1 hypothetical protein [Muribaculaceae bacterium]
MKAKKFLAVIISVTAAAVMPFAVNAYAGGCTEVSGNSAVKEIPGKFAGYAVYEKYGLLYDGEKDCYTYNGSVVRFFNDPIAGASFTNFFTGTVDIEAEYDEKNNLIGVKECSKEVYDRHTKKHKNL